MYKRRDKVYEHYLTNECYLSSDSDSDTDLNSDNVSVLKRYNKSCCTFNKRRCSSSDSDCDCDYYDNKYKVARNYNASTILSQPTLPATFNDSITNKEEEQCSICLNNKKCIVFIECHHLQTCCACTRIILDSTNKTCPCCRTPITANPVFVYF